ncbi:MAG TPA: glycosyltransferase, partial [Chloroflexota bacterium]|nr:glycosyltransferase [Chloroflexota bacterium]
MTADSSPHAVDVESKVPDEVPAVPITLSVVIPALNEEAGIADIIQRVQAVELSLKEVGVDCLEIIVVDDGSHDRTP